MVVSASSWSLHASHPATAEGTGDCLACCLRFADARQLPQLYPPRDPRDPRDMQLSLRVCFFFYLSRCLPPLAWCIPPPILSVLGAYAPGVSRACGRSRAACATLPCSAMACSPSAESWRRHRGKKRHVGGRGGTAEEPTPSAPSPPTYPAAPLTSPARPPTSDATLARDDVSGDQVHVLGYYVEPYTSASATGPGPCRLGGPAASMSTWAGV